MTNMSRVERRKAQNLYEDQNAAALADDYFDDDGESLPTRQSVKNQKEQKKKQGKTKTPLFTVLAVLFVFVPVIVLVTLFYLKSHPDNHDDYEDVFIDSSQSKYEIVPKSEEKKDNEDTKVTKEAALQQESKKKSEDTKVKEPAKTTTDQKQPAVAEKEDSANKEEATAAAASSSQQTAARQEQQPAESVQPEPKRVVKHTVQKKETLYRISMKYYKSRSGEEKIRAYNHLNGNDVYTGQVLDIPLVD
ncbi:LysM peptidoglycan-binding domain-containing protein [Bacillus inaquosorum]|uniref:LysM peptidoglycan-binding domain-containing protein n=1 Tax=Bacillus inaquosorum TaxID=483913 RepID=UPI00227DB8D8|nr:LysM peptidoglycan-binding domain-containing protein [Bacillus inaquosorum]MCY9094182.1 LysM peptidoglycan-binding domain-containing protein [Bacillus inaquosorum]